MPREPGLPHNVPPHVLEALQEHFERAKANPRPLHRALFSIADAYSVTASLALDRLKATGKSDFATVAVVNASFAIELLLKFFVAVDRPTLSAADLHAEGLLHGHEYSRLWPRVSDAHKVAIITRFFARTRRQVSAGQFLELLQAIGDAPFVFWRYAYERPGPFGADLTLLGHLMHATGEAASEALRALESTDGAGATG